MRKCRWFVLGCGVALCVVVAGCSTSGPSSKQPVKPIAADSKAPAGADGISFVKDGALQFIVDGRTHTVGAAGKVLAVGRGSDVGGIVVMDATGASAGKVSWYASDAAKPTPLWRSQESGNLGVVRYIKGIDAVWFSTYGDPVAVLKSASPPSGAQMVRTLDSGFNGEFDVDAKGETLAYVGKSQNPSSITIRDSEGANALPLSLALVFSPDLSTDGTQLCFVGGQKASDLSVWVYELQGRAPRELDQTRGLGPTSPVFSEDGSRVAFRSTKDGTLWMVDVKQGIPVKLPFTADEGPIGW